MTEVTGTLSGATVSSPREELEKAVAEPRERTKRYYFTLRPSFIRQVDHYRKICGKKYTSRDRKSVV